MTQTLSPHYTDEEIAQAMAALAANGGRLRPTARALKDEGIELTHETLRDWRDNRHRNLYERALVQIEKDLAQKTEAAYDRLLGLEQQTMDKYADNLDDLAPKELAPAIKSLAIASGVHNQNARLLRSQPTQITEHRLPQELFTTLTRITGIDADTTAEEQDQDMQDAQVVDDQPSLPATLPTPHVPRSQ